MEIYVLKVCCISMIYIDETYILYLIHRHQDWGWVNFLQTTHYGEPRVWVVMKHSFRLRSFREDWIVIILDLVLYAWW